MEAEKTKIGPCPFCGSDQAKLHESSNKYFYWVSCRNNDCITVGPSCQTREGAIEAWNAPNAKIADLEAKLAEAVNACVAALEVIPALPKLAGYDLRVEARQQLAAVIEKAMGKA